MSLPVKHGQRCLVVQCDQVTGEPVPDGLAIRAVAVQFHANEDIDVVADPGPDGTWVPTRFCGSDAWNTYGRERAWRLMLPDDFEPDPEPGHGYHEAGDY